MEVRLGFEQGAKATPKHGVVICEEDPKVVAHELSDAANVWPMVDFLPQFVESLRQQLREVDAGETSLPPAPTIRRSLVSNGPVVDQNHGGQVCRSRRTDSGPTGHESGGNDKIPVELPVGLCINNEPPELAD